MDDIANKITDLIVETYSVARDRVTPDASFASDLEVDELDVIELVIRTEKQFGVSISDHEAKAMKQVSDLISCVRKLQTCV